MNRFTPIFVLVGFFVTAAGLFINRKKIVAKYKENPRKYILHSIIGVAITLFAGIVLLYFIITSGLFGGYDS